MSTVLLPIIAAAAVGIGTLWSNRKRPLNQAFFCASILTVAWLLAVEPALAGGSGTVASIRAASAVGAFYPWALWWIRVSVNPQRTARRERIIGMMAWGGASLGLFALCFLPSFVQSGVSPETPRFGAPQLVYLVGLLIAYTVLLVQTIARLGRVKGIELVELRILLIGGIGACVAGLLLTTLSALVHLPLQRYAPSVVLVFYGITAWAVSSHRIFDASYVWLTTVQWALLIVVLAAWWYACEATIGRVVPAPLNILIAIGTAVALFVALTRPLRRIAAFAGLRTADNARREVLRAAREIADSTALTNQLENILQAWAGTNAAEILCPSVDGTALAGRTASVSLESVILHVLGTDGWATPEALERRPLDANHAVLSRWLAENRAGAAIAVPGPAEMPVELLLVLGAKCNGKPYLWPEIAGLLELAEVIEHALARAQLTRKARESEHIASVGMMGACIAHEMRNPLVALSAAAELLEDKHADPQFRSTFAQLLNREVGRITNLSEELKRFSATPDPVPSRVDVYKVIVETVELMSARITKAGVEVAVPTRNGGETALADPLALRQVFLNLLGNALDAVEGRAGARIQIRVSHTEPGIVAIEISDNGPGVSPRAREKLFTPFSSDKSNGFGLGLAFSARLIRSLRGTLSLMDADGPGATFRVTLPCPPPSSS